MLDMTKDEIRRRVIFYVTLFIIAAAALFVLYSVVYVRCYNIMNIDDMIVLKFFRNNDGVYAVWFNKIYKLFE